MATVRIQSISPQRPSNASLTSFNSPSTCLIAPTRANLPTMLAAKELFCCPSSLWEMTSTNALSTSPKITNVKQSICRRQWKHLERETRRENIAKGTFFCLSDWQQLKPFRRQLYVFTNGLRGFSCQRFRSEYQTRGKHAWNNARRIPRSNVSPSRHES